MLKNYLKVSLRNIQKHKALSLINISGLSIGMACCMLILLLIKSELNYDSFNKRAKNIYRIVVDFNLQGIVRRIPVVSPPIGPALQKEFPEIKEAVRIRNAPQTLVKSGEREFYENSFYLIDQNVFKVFSFNLIKGDKESVLSEPNSVVISEDAAKKYFAENNPIGKILTIDWNGSPDDFKVTGIIDNVPANSEIRPDFMIPFTQLGNGKLNNWWDFGTTTYLLLNDNSRVDELESKFPQFMKLNLPPDPMTQVLPKLNLQPLLEVHLHSDFGNDSSQMSPMTYIYIYSALALFLILIASINFMNLSTARSQTRSKEIGIRKVVGANRTQLIKQFIVESLLTSFLSLIIAMILVELFIPSFDSLTDNSINLINNDTIGTLAVFIILVILVGLLSGSYPALFLSGQQPVSILKGFLTKHGNAASFRKILVVFQFTISTALICGTIIIFSQLEYVKNKNLGFDTKNLIILPLNSDVIQKSAEVLKSDILSNNNVISATLSSSFPSKNNWARTIVHLNGTPAKDFKEIYTFETDFDYLKTLKAKIIAGRDLKKKFATDSTSFIINQAAVSYFGWISPEEAVGKRISWLGNGPDHPENGTIIGVVTDFNYLSLHNKVEPAVIHIEPDLFDYVYLSARVKNNAESDVLDAMSKYWKSIDPFHPFEYSFFEQNVNQQYKDEIKLEKVFGIFALLSVLIACLGLFGLTSFSTEQRTKEIGIRKIMGASRIEILVLLSKGFIKLVLISNLIAFPLVFWYMNRWLEDFAYHISISFIVFIITTLLSLVIALLTIIAQALKVSNSNPVEALRYE